MNPFKIPTPISASCIHLFALPPWSGSDIVPLYRRSGRIPIACTESTQHKKKAVQCETPWSNSPFNMLGSSDHFLFNILILLYNWNIQSAIVTFFEEWLVSECRNLSAFCHLKYLWIQVFCVFGSQLLKKKFISKCLNCIFNEMHLRKRIFQFFNEISLMIQFSIHNND